MSGEPYVITEACVDTTDRASVGVCRVQSIDEIESDPAAARRLLRAGEPPSGPAIRMPKAMAVR